MKKKRRKEEEKKKKKIEKYGKKSKGHVFPKRLTDTMHVQPFMPQIHIHHTERPPKIGKFTVLHQIVRGEDGHFQVVGGKIKDRHFIADHVRESVMRRAGSELLKMQEKHVRLFQAGK